MSQGLALTLSNALNRLTLREIKLEKVEALSDEILVSLTHHADQRTLKEELPGVKFLYSIVVLLLLHLRQHNNYNLCVFRLFKCIIYESTLCAIHLSMYTLQMCYINKEHTHQHLLIYVGFCHPPCQGYFCHLWKAVSKDYTDPICAKKCSLLCTIHLFMSLLLFRLCYLLVSSSIIRSALFHASYGKLP